jgi:hypothetical protein
VRAYIILLPVQHYLLTFFLFPVWGELFHFFGSLFLRFGRLRGVYLFFRCDVGALVARSLAFWQWDRRIWTGNWEMGNWETGNWEMEKISRVYTDLGLGIWDLGWAVHARLGVLGTGLGQTRQRLFGWLG